MGFMRGCLARCLRRPFLTFVITSVVFAAVALGVWHFGVYPQTFRGRFERVQPGMTEEQVCEILGPPYVEPEISRKEGVVIGPQEDVVAFTPDFSKWYQECWSGDRSGWKEVCNGWGGWALPNGPAHKPHSHLFWFSGEGISIAVYFDRTDGVICKTWTDTSKSPTIFTKIRQWAGIP